MRNCFSDQVDDKTCNLECFISKFVDVSCVPLNPVFNREDDRVSIGYYRRVPEHQLPVLYIWYAQLGVDEHIQHVLDPVEMLLYMVGDVHKEFGLVWHLLRKIHRLYRRIT